MRKGRTVKITVGELTITIFAVLGCFGWIWYALNADFQLAAAFVDEASRRSYRLSLVAIAISFLAMYMTFFLSHWNYRLYKEMDSKLEEILTKSEPQRISLANIETQINALSAAIKGRNDTTPED